MAELLFTQHDQGYSWSNDHSYYQCTQEEYEEMLAKYKDHKNYKEVVYGGTKYTIPNNEQVTIGKITANPCTIVSDGWCERGGREFRAEGITIKSVIGVGNDCSSFRHYIKPGSIVKNEQTKHEGWWA